MQNDSLTPSNELCDRDGRALDAPELRRRAEEGVRLRYEQLMKRVREHDAVLAEIEGILERLFGWRTQVP